jgi:GT2 family glycosyltransferase
MTSLSGVRIAAVMTVYNRVDLTLACLRSLRRQDALGATLDIYVVDDASTDGTADRVCDEHPDVVLLRGNGDLFWNGGMRLAFGAALRGDYDHYLWMNDDTRLDDGALRRLLETERTLRERGEPPAIVVGSTRHPETGLLSYGGVRRTSSRRPLSFMLVAPGEDPEPAETMNGNIALVPREVARRVGNIDPAYRQKMGDFDYGLRARKQGCAVWVAPGTIGECATHPGRRTDEQPLLDELRRLWSVKELPPRPWATFVRRWAGPLWPAYWLSPYVRRGAGLVAERVARPKARSTA